MRRLVALKSADGSLTFKDFSTTDLVDWFKDNTDDEGNVQDEIILYNHGIITFGEEDTKEEYKDGIPFILSTYDLDRDSERIDQTGWDLKNFKANPVVLWSHIWSEPSIGKMTSIRIKDGNLKGKIEFVPREIDQFGWSIGEKVKLGYLNSGSVGFKPIKIELVEDDKDPTKLIHRKQELYEFSIVNLPSNTNARSELGLTEEGASGEIVEKPYPNEHACRLNSPDKYDRIRRVNCDQKHDGKCIDVIYGINKGEPVEIQALRYPKDIWTESAARAHCKSREGTFEAAGKESPDDERIDDLMERVEKLEKRNKDYIASVLRDLGGDTSLPRDRDTSDLFTKREREAIDILFK